MARSDDSLLPGTLDMLALKSLEEGPRHGYSIARWIQAGSGDVLAVEEGSLYPALHRLARRGWVAAEWGTSESNRRAKFYRLTSRGRTPLAKEASAWERMAGAVTRVMATGPTGAEA